MPEWSAKIKTGFQVKNTDLFQLTAGRDHQRVVS